MKRSSRRRAALLLLVTTLFISACGTLDRGPRTFTLTDKDLSRLLDQQGPKQRRFFDVLDVKINRPIVHLLPESNRLSTELNVVTTERVSGDSYNGRLAVDYALRYDEASQAIRMTQVRVNDLQIDNLPAAQKGGAGKTAALKRLGLMISEHLLEDAVVYRFKAADLKSAEGKGYKPSAVTVTSRGVEVTLAPLAR